MRLANYLKDYKWFSKMSMDSRILEGREGKVDDKLLCLFEGSESLYEWRCVMIVAMKIDCQR
jgi:hypothetical protein